MLLSEAMRLGAMMKPGCRGDLEKRNRSGIVLRTCALGAALDAIGLMDGRPEEADFYLDSPEEWSDLIVAEVGCPAMRCRCENRVRGVLERYHGAVTDVIWHLNDEHRWSRTRIADWVKTVEDGLAGESAPIKGLVLASA